MEIDNKLRTSIVRTWYIVILALLAALTAYYSFEYLSDIMGGIVISVMVIMVLIYIIMLILKMDYFYIDDKRNKLTIRYYTAHPVFRKYKMFEIPTVYFTGFNVKKSFFGLKKELLLSAKTPKGVINFPPVSISALSKTEYSAIKKILNKNRKK